MGLALYGDILIMNWVEKVWIMTVTIEFSIPRPSMGEVTLTGA